MDELVDLCDLQVHPFLPGEGENNVILLIVILILNVFI